MYIQAHAPLPCTDGYVYIVHTCMYMYIHVHIHTLYIYTCTCIRLLTEFISPSGDIKIETHVRVATCAYRMVPLKCTVAFQNSAALIIRRWLPKYPVVSLTVDTIAYSANVPAYCVHVQALIHILF